MSDKQEILLLKGAGMENLEELMLRSRHEK